MKNLELNQMEVFIGGETNDDIFYGSVCGATVVLAASFWFAPLAVLTGAVCAVGLIGYATDTIDK